MSDSRKSQGNPETSKRRESGETGDHAVGERWKDMMSQLGKDPRRVENVSCVGNLLIDVKEQMMMRLDEIRDTCAAAETILRQPHRSTKLETVPSSQDSVTRRVHNLHISDPLAAQATLPAPPLSTLGELKETAKTETTVQRVPSMCAVRS